ncbi:hypothetical protein L3W71_18695, partial [Escherichia coli]|nr:hypothetical protein [Escherichia coli]
MLYAFKLGRKLRGEEPYCPEKGGKGGSSDKSAKYAAEAQKYGKRAARTVLTGMCYSVGSATRQGSSSLTR